ncbi:MAG: DUF3617 family protein [Pseudomonadota bacterium]
MASWRNRYIAALFTCCALPGFAAELPKIKAGQWEIMTVLPGGQPFVHRECLKEDFLSANAAAKQAPGDRCVDKDIRQKGATYTREMRCTNANGQTELRRGQWTVKSDIYLESKSERVVNGKTEPVAEVFIVRAGDCPSATPR